MQYFALKILQLLEERRQHLVSDSKREPDVILRWYPTDPCRSSLASQLAYRHERKDVLTSVVPEPLPLTLNESGIVEPDTAQQLESVSNGTGSGGFDLIVCINMVHISPWSATIGLFQVASQYLRRDDENAGAALVLYGPFRVQGTMVESNVCVNVKSIVRSFIKHSSSHLTCAHHPTSLYSPILYYSRFDEWLKGQDPSFGVRNLEDVVHLADHVGLHLAETVEMPANNLCLVFRRRRPPR